MGKPVGKASGRTFRRIMTHFPDPCWSSLLVTFSFPLRCQMNRLPKPWRAVYPWPLMHPMRITWIVFLRSHPFPPAPDCGSIRSRNRRNCGASPGGNRPDKGSTNCEPNGLRNVSTYKYLCPGSPLSPKRSSGSPRPVSSNP
jgi:hypothetical protein